MPTEQTGIQRERQEHRRRDGRYSTVNPCEVCGRSAGVVYCSDRRVNSTDQAGNAWGVHGLVLCSRCCGKLHALDDAAAFYVVIGKRPAPWIRYPGAAFQPYVYRGRFTVEPVGEKGDGWNAIDNLDNLCIAMQTKEEAAGVATFARDYVRVWGDIDFSSFPFSVEQELHYDDVPLRERRPWLRERDGSER